MHVLAAFIRCSVSLIYVLLFMPQLGSFVYYYFATCFDVSYYKISCFVLFTQNWFDYLWSFSKVFSISVKNVIIIFMDIALNLSINLGAMGILAIIILLIHKHGMSLQCLPSMLCNFHCRDHLLP